MRYLSISTLMTANPATAPEPDRYAACPSCGAVAHATVSWCTLCFASLTPPEPTPQPTPASEPPAQDRPEAGAPTSDVGAPTSDVDAIADRMLAELAATGEPKPGWTAKLPRTGGAKAGVIVGGVVIGSLLLVSLMTVVGLFL